MKTMIRALVGLGLVAGVAVAQNPPAAQPKAAPQPKAQVAPQAGQPGQPGQMRGPGPMNRQQLEQQLRNRIGNQLKKGLNLSDDQFTKLQATNKKFEERRHLLNEQERDARMAMRDLMLSGDTTNAAKVNAGIDRALQIARQRFDLIDQEQKELAGYLTPMQRARFLAMQEQVRRRVDDLRAQAGRRGPNGPMGRGMGQGARPGVGPGMGQGMGRGMAPGMGPGMMGQQPGPGLGQQRLMRPRLRQGVNAPPVAAPQPAPVKPPVEP
jgi:hypothetical protein